MTHAELGASGAHRWMACPGSVHLSEGLPDRTSAAAEEGTAAHMLLEECLYWDEDPDVFAAKCAEGQIYLGQSDGEVVGVPLTEEMLSSVQTAVDFVREHRPHIDGPEMHVEKEVSLARLNPPVPMYGTADVVLWNPTTKDLHVIDFKYGAGVVVEVQDNPQLLYYVLGAMLTLDIVPTSIKTTVIQPRAFHPDGPIRTAEYTYEYILQFKQDLLASAERTQEPNAPLVVGDHCQFCRARAVCPAQKEHAVAVVQSSFEAAKPPDPKTLTTEDLSRIVVAQKIIAGFMDSARDELFHRVQGGETGTGWKLVEGRKGNRKWRDEREATAYFRLQGMYPYEEVILSPAKIEKIAKGVGVEIESFVTRAEGKPTLAPESDKRPALQSVRDAFKSLPREIEE